MLKKGKDNTERRRDTIDNNNRQVSGSYGNINRYKILRSVTFRFTIFSLFPSRQNNNNN